MIRASAIAKQVMKELEFMGVDVNNGSTGEVAEKAKAAFAGRSLTDYYTEGKHRLVIHTHMQVAF